MNKKFLSAILFGALMVTSTGTFVSCKDYEDDIKDVQEQVDANKAECAAAIKALQDQATALQSALATAQSTADAAKKAAADAQTAADKAAAAAQQAAAEAKEEAIAKALEEVNALKAWVESQNYVTEEGLAEALLPISAKIAAIEESLDQIIVYMQENLEANIQIALKNIMALQEDLAIQQATLDKYAAILEELGNADAELWAELTSTREELQQAVSALNVLLEDEVGALWAELTSTREGLQETLTSLKNIVDENYEDLNAEITTTREGLQEALTALNNLVDLKIGELSAELTEEITTTREGLQEAITNLNNLVADNTANIEDLQNEVGSIYAAIGQTATNLNNLIALNEEKTQVKFDEVWAEIASNNSAVNEAITSVYNQVLDLNALINNNAANIQDLNDQLLTLHLLVKGYLTSMVFAPSFYVDGIEAIPFRTLKYNPWINLATAQEGQAQNALTLSDGTTEASYYVSPAYIDVESIESLNVLLNDAVNMKSRAAAEVTATVKSFANGKLTVNLKKNTTKEFGGEGNEFKVMALQANVNRGNLNPNTKNHELYTVTSDWARIHEAHYLPQIHAANEKVEIPHLWSYVDAIAATEGQYIIATSDYMTPINLNDLVTVCLTDVEDESTSAMIRLSADEIAAYGMKFEFNLLKEYMLKVGQSVEETNQEKFATIAVDENGDYIMSSCAMNGTPNNADAIGREPLVQVVLKDEVNGKFVDVNYFKIKWTAVTKNWPLGSVEEFDDPEENLFACTTEYTFKVGTEKMNAFFYTKLNKSKEEFHLIYKPEANASEDADGESFILYSDEECTKVVDNAGTVKQVLAEGSTTTYNLVWDYTTGEITAEEWAAKKVERTVYMKYVNQANPAETITFSMTFVLYIEDMALAAGYVQTYWSGELAATNAGKMFQVNPALTSDINYGIEKYYDCRFITNLLNGYNVTGIDANDLIIKDIVSANVAGAKFIFDINRIKMTWTAQWTVSEDGTQLLYKGVPAAEITVVGKKPYIKLYEKPRPTVEAAGIPTDGAKELIGKKVPVQLVATHCSGHTTVLDSYLVHFIEPLAAKFNMTEGKLEDLLTGGASLDIRTAITVAEKFGLKRDVIYVDENGKLAANQELVGWYAVEPATWDLENAKTNLNINGDDLVITEEFATNFTAHKDKYQLEVVKNASGYPVELKFHNFSGTHIQQAFKVQIPVYVNTKWNSKLTAEPTYVEVTIVPGVTE